jgi:hypothetical protein
VASAKRLGLCTKISHFVQSVADHGVDGMRAFRGWDLARNVPLDEIQIKLTRKSKHVDYSSGTQTQRRQRKTSFVSFANAPRASSGGDPANRIRNHFGDFGTEPLEPPAYG